MDEKTKQIITIAVCMLIFVLGLVYDYTTWQSNHISLFKIFFG